MFVEKVPFLTTWNGRKEYPFQGIKGLIAERKFIRMPIVAQASLPEPHFTDIFGTELSALLSNSFLCDNDSALCQQILDILEAQAESVMEPDGLADYMLRDTMSVIVGSIARH
jgi:hypothetical protein